MLYRKTYLESRTSLGNSGERTIDINVRDPITLLWIEFRCPNGATSNIANLLADCITAIEVVDGATVLYSLDGHEALALATYQMDRLPDQLISEFPGVTQNLAVPIFFGRFEGDTEFAFDPTRFVNPQVKVSWNLAANQAVGSTGFATGGLVVTVLAIVMEGAPSPRAMLVHKEHYTYTTVAGVEYIDLPVDHVYRGLLFRADLAAYSLYALVNRLKLNCDAGKYIPFDMRMTDLLRYGFTKHGPFGYQHTFYVSDDTTIFFIMKYNERVSFQCSSLDNVVFRYVYAGKGEGKLYMDSADTAETSDRTVMAQCVGGTPFRSIYLPFGDPDKPGDWFPAPTFGSIRLEATGAVASAAGSVVLSQEYAY